MFEEEITLNFLLKQKHFVQSMRTRTRRNECGEYKLFFVDYHTVIGENIVEPPYFIREKHEKVKENSQKREKNAKKDKKKNTIKNKKYAT